MIGGTKCAIHHVDVDHPRTRLEDLVDLRAQPREVRGQDRRRDPALEQQAGAHAHTGCSMLPWQWLQEISAVLDIRTIVECSPQLGHTETSSKR